MEDVRYCSLILSRYDRLRLLNVPSNLVSIIRECINKQWYLQLLKQKDYHGTTEFKLGGCPWWADGNDAVEARYFISSLVGNLKSHGWEVCGTIDLSRHNNDKSTFLLRQCPPTFAPHMCVSFNKANRIRLIVSRYVVFLLLLFLLFGVVFYVFRTVFPTVSAGSSSTIWSTYFLVLRMVLEVPDLQYKMSIKKQWCFWPLKSIL